MKMEEIKKMAKSLGFTISPEIKKIEVIKAIQRKEGNFDCFGTAVNYCNQAKCLFKKDCLVLTK